MCAVWATQSAPGGLPGGRVRARACAWACACACACVCVCVCARARLRACARALRAHACACVRVCARVFVSLPYPGASCLPPVVMVARAALSASAVPGVPASSTTSFQHSRASFRASGTKNDDVGDSGVIYINMGVLQDMGVLRFSRGSPPPPPSVLAI